MIGAEKMTCFKTGWASLLNGDLWIKWASIASNVATVIAVVVAIFAAVIAFRQLISSGKESRRSTANQIYQQYLAMCIEYPYFSRGLMKPHRRKVEYTKYCWFVSSMLFSFEQILETDPDDKQWIITIESQLKMHSSHLKISRTANSEQWDKNLDGIIKRVISQN